VCSRNQHEINSVVKEIENINNQVNVLGSKCDVRVSSQVNSLVQSAADKFGSESIGILVNNGGVAFDKKLVDTSEEEWDQIMDTNLKGAFLLTKAVLPYMTQKELWKYGKCKFWGRQIWFCRFIILLCKQVWTRGVG